MSKCDIQVEFYRPDRTWRTGETVQGWVRVSVDRDVRCRSLSILAFWNTHGQGSIARKNYYQETLFQGAWKNGDRYEYAFEFEPPVTPLTWHGHHFNLDHYVAVRVDIPWGHNPRCSEQFIWLPGEKVVSAEPAGNSYEQRINSVSGYSITLASLLAVMCGTWLLIVGNWTGVLFLAGAALLAFFGFRQKVADLLLGKVHWDVPEQISPGESLTTRVTARPGRRSRIRDVDLRLTGLEAVMFDQGSKRCLLEHEIFDRTYAIDARTPDKTSQDNRLEKTLTFPLTDAWSIDLPANRVIWELKLQITLGWWPNWSRTRTIQVVPSPGGLPRPAPVDPDRT